MSVDENDNLQIFTRVRESGKKSQQAKEEMISSLACTCIILVVMFGDMTFNYVPQSLTFLRQSDLLGTSLMVFDPEW